MRHYQIDQLSIYELSKLSYKEVMELAGSIADKQKSFISSCPSHSVEHHALSAFEFGIQLKRTSKSTTSSLVARLIDKSFWAKKLIKIANAARETIAVRCLTLGPKEPYCSDASVEFFLEKQFRRFSSSFKRLNSECERAASQSYVFAKALSQKANASGLVSVFITTTLDAEYHSSSTQYTCKTFEDGYNVLSKIQSSLIDGLSYISKRGEDFYGFRCVEVHIDGCPHFHTVLYVKPKLIPFLKNRLRELYYKQSERMGKYYDEHEDNILKLRQPGNEKYFSEAVSYVFKNSFAGRAGDRKAFYSALRQKIAISSFGKHQYEFIGLNGKISVTRDVQRFQSVNQISNALGCEAEVRNPRSRLLLLTKKLLEKSVKIFSKKKQSYRNRYGEMTFRTSGVEINRTVPESNTNKARMCNSRVIRNYYIFLARTSPVQSILIPLRNLAAAPAEKHQNSIFWRMKSPLSG